MNELTNVADLQARIAEKNYLTFTFPVLNITVQHRRPNLLSLSIDGSLPAALADAVIKAYKGTFNGENLTELQQKMAEQNQIDEKAIADFRNKGYKLLTELVVSPKIMDVPESDFSTNPPLVSWKDIPEEDALAFVMHIFQVGNKTTEDAGGEMSSADILPFSDEKQMSERHPTRKKRKAVRDSA